MPSATTSTLVHRRPSHSGGRRARSNSWQNCMNAGGLESPLSSRLPTSPVPTLASIRIIVLAELAEIEARLAQVKDKAPSARVEDATCVVRKIREDVCGCLPDLNLDMAAIESLVTEHLPHWAEVKSHLPALDAFSFGDMRSKLAELPDIRSRLPDWERVLQAMRGHLHDLDDRLQALNTHPLRRPSQLLAELLDKVTASDFFDDWRESEENSRKEEAMALTTAGQIVTALKASAHGARYISYNQLPDKWKNNEYVHRGYRFIPLSNWKSLALSAFCFHNETLNIHTHFVPFAVSFVTCAILGPSAEYESMPDMIYTYFARVCLLTSAIWHTFSGCAHPGAMEFFARLDYVGIGWLISASVASVVYFGMSCHATAACIYFSACLLSALVGSFLPFMPWFNERKHKKWRLAYFIFLSLSGISPVVHLGIIHHWWPALVFVSAIIPSLAAYGIGVFFYAAHFPECLYAHDPRPKWADWLDTMGASSHALWHICILLGIWLHRYALHLMKSGFDGELCELW